MDQTIERRLASAIAREIRKSSLELTQRWLKRIAAQVATGAALVVDTDEMLTHAPILVDGIASYVEDPVDEFVDDDPVISKAIELGRLRHGQGFTAEQILKEYELLGGVLFAFLVRTVGEIGEPCPPGELLSCAHRVFRAVEVVQQATTSQFVELARERVKEREDRLRGFNRMVTHELKTRVGAVTSAAGMLAEQWIREDPAQFERFMGIVATNGEAIQMVLRDLLELSQADESGLQGRSVRLPDAVREVARQQGEAAAERGVEIRLRPDLPEVEVNGPALEICLTNYLSNAIKYSDRGQAERWAEVGAEIRGTGGGSEVVVWVRDNGIGVPPELRDGLFERFFRAGMPGSEGVEGTGLGLNIVRETAEALGGRAWAEFGQDRGSIFKFSLPPGRPVVEQPAA